MLTPAAVPVQKQSSRDSENQRIWLNGMAWVVPNFTKEEVNTAGKLFVRLLLDDTSEWGTDEWEKYNHTVEIINNWRACHGYPLHTFQINLRRAANRFDSNALTARRTKRLISIAQKLHRLPKMKLTQMQDIGGCRAVVKSLAAVRQLDLYYQKESNIKHELITRDDYITWPQKSGYRGIHLVYRYFSDKKAKAIYNDLKIEIQLRSQYQHAWATAVETVGTFVRHALKSSQGPDEWLRFFALMGTAIAIRENAPLVPNTPTKRAELVAELDQYADKANRSNNDFEHIANQCVREAAA